MDLRKPLRDHTCIELCMLPRRHTSLCTRIGIGNIGNLAVSCGLPDVDSCCIIHISNDLTTLSFPMLWFKSNKVIDEFSAKLATDLAQRYPPALENEKPR